MTTLRYMSMRNRQNTLSTWVNQGGELWALGGGFGNATNTTWNSAANDLNGVRTYTSLVSTAAPIADLVPGRFMYDLAHWRSEFRVFKGFIRFARLRPDGPELHAADGLAGRGRSAIRATTTLPTALQSRTPTTDPLSLGRSGAPPTTTSTTRPTAASASTSST